MTGFVNPLATLASRTPSRQCAHSIRRSFKTTFTTIPEEPERRSPSHRMTARHHQQRRKRLPKYINELPKAIQYP
jgi:hypothetical protein